MRVGEQPGEAAFGQRQPATGLLRLLRIAHHRVQPLHGRGDDADRVLGTRSFAQQVGLGLCESFLQFDLPCPRIRIAMQQVREQRPGRGEVMQPLPRITLPAVHRGLQQAAFRLGLQPLGVRRVEVTLRARHALRGVQFTLRRDQFAGIDQRFGEEAARHQQSAQGERIARIAPQDSFVQRDLAPSQRDRLVDLQVEQRRRRHPRIVLAQVEEGRDILRLPVDAPDIHASRHLELGERFSGAALVQQQRPQVAMRIRQLALPLRIGRVERDQPAREFLVIEEGLFGLGALACLPVAGITHPEDALRLVVDALRIVGCALQQFGGGIACAQEGFERAATVAAAVAQVADHVQRARTPAERIGIQRAGLLAVVVAQCARGDGIERVQAADRFELPAQVAEHEFDQSFGLRATRARIVAGAGRQQREAAHRNRHDRQHDRQRG